MGRPPGALSGNRRRAYPYDWELRDPARYAARFEELDSDLDDGHGVMLDPKTFASRDARRRGYAGDDLYFDGHDLGQDRALRRGVYDAHAYDGYLSEEENYYEQRAAAYQTAVRNKQDSLLQSALDRIARAREKGKTNINLTTDEMEALERRGSQQPEPSSSLASPPTTPARGKGKPGSRASSSTNLATQKGRKKGNSSFFGAPAKSNSKAKVTRKNSAEQAVSYPGGAAPPGIMVPGPNGVPVFAPIAYYGPPSPEFARSNRSPGESRSSSKHSRRESTPPDQLQPPFQPRYYHGANGRPDSQGSNRSLPDDIDWHPPPPARTRSASNAQYAGAYRHPGEDYDMAAPPMPAAQQRRHVSGPPDVRYSAVRRAPPSSSPLAQRHSPAAANGSELQRTDTSGSSSSSSDDQGVQVDIVPDDGGGYAIRQMSALELAPAVSGTGPPRKAGGNEAKKRKGARR